jgi:alanine dehydrogenase
MTAPGDPGDTVFLGLPRMHKEPGERRDFLPDFVSRLTRRGAQVTLEESYGAGLGLPEDAFAQSDNVRFAPREEAYHQPWVIVLRAPTSDELDWMAPGSLLISMLHYPTRPERVADLRRRGLEAISLDSIKDDSGRRLVENLKAVAWNGIRQAFAVLAQTYPAPGFTSPRRPPIRVTLLGAGAVGSHVVRAAALYGDLDLRSRLAKGGVAGVVTQTVDFDVTGRADVMRDLLAATDVLVDATQRPDPSRPVIPNAWIEWLPSHAVILDLSVDPYDCDLDPPYLKGIEGIPHGNLDRFLFPPDDPAYDRLPPCVDASHRRHALSCYSWPGLEPSECMRHYGQQIQPILRVLIERGGPQAIRPRGRFFERAIARALLSRWDP